MRSLCLCALSLLAVAAVSGEPAGETPPVTPPVEVQPEVKSPDILQVQSLPFEVNEPGFKAKAVFPESAIPAFPSPRATSAPALPGERPAPSFKRLLHKEWNVPQEDGQPANTAQDENAEDANREALEATREQISPLLAKVIARDKGPKRAPAKEMILAYQDVLKFEPENAPAYYRLGLTFLRAGEKVNAMNALDSALGLDQKNTKYMCDAGLAALQAGSIDKAMRLCHLASVKAPAVARYQSALGDCLSRNGNMPEALQAYTRATKLEPNNTEYIHNLAACNLRAGAFKMAIEIVEEAIRIRPSVSMYYCTRGLAFEQLRNIKQAQTDYNRAILLDKQNAYAYYLLAGTYSDPDDPTYTNAYEAVTAATQAVKLTQERHAQYLMGLARALRVSRNYDSAITVARSAVAMEPRDDYKQELGKLEKIKKEGF